MKKFKKIFAVLLTLAMVLGMSMTTFAANLTNGSFTVTELKAGTKVSYAQILQQNKDTSKWEFTTDATGKLSWTGENSPEMTVESLVADGADLSKLAGLGSLSYGHETTATDGTAVFSDLPAGLYAVKAVDPTNEYVYSFMIAKVDYDKGALVGSNLEAKGQKNVPEKEASTSSVVPGEVVLFTVKVNYPMFATGSTERKMEIVDTVKNGTIVRDTVEIKDVAGNSLSNLFNVPEINGNTLKITLNADKYDYSKAGNQVVITYNVKADDGIYNTLENKVENKVPGSDGKDHSSQAIVILPNVDTEITKVDEKDEVIVTSSATFELYKEVKADYEPKAGETVVDLDVFVPGTPSSQTTVKAIQIGDAKTTTDGKVTFEGLEPDPKKATYYVKETAAPDGYSVEPLARKLTGATITAGKPTILKEGDEGYTKGVVTVVTKHEATGFTTLDGFTGLKFKDTKLGSLPSTGGIGTTIFTIGGCAIMIIAAALFFASRRKSSK